MYSTYHPGSPSSSPESCTSFRRRSCGRAHSPPTWAWYEQIHPDCDEDSLSGSDEDSGSDDEESNAASGDNSALPQTAQSSRPESTAPEVDIMEIDGISESSESKSIPSSSELKGKQRLVDSDESPEPSVKKQRRRKQRHPIYNYKPIVTIMSSQGFVWNQELFVPSYIKDRYRASTSPPSSFGSSAPSFSTCDFRQDGEIEVVEIRVTGKELDNIIP
ncbi:hypothetical protein SISSUDRAFT_1044770 [Sistotremastrum suecicum HHB10207 ss-3]|uniref:Uncharacterized protein n=1 Tax=Sistotremastrum suecicum HHB10207 ss-3 TaxID=1314776 RepID=A0A166EVD5_9AGAM|nr:hypothetical protein SISSUDRAFT_1044770 [Sistotremastrum suecicum HHB10207 ss-3]